MKLTYLAIAAGLVLGGLAGAPAVRADGWHHHGGHWHGGPHSSVSISIGTWRGGYWHHGYYGPRYGWWWVVPTGYYYYPEPVYPYPDYYRPPVVVVEREAPPPVVGVPPQQYWYRCDDPDGYYPYVPECRGEWKKVPATPPDARE
jgi:hypothetical protein